MANPIPLLIPLIVTALFICIWMVIFHSFVFVVMYSLVRDLLVNTWRLLILVPVVLAVSKVHSGTDSLVLLKMLTFIICVIYEDFYTLLNILKVSGIRCWMSALVPLSLEIRLHM